MLYYIKKVNNKNKREGCGGCGERSEPQHCPEERSDEGIAEAIAKPVAARPEHTTTISNLLNDIFCRFETIEYDDLQSLEMLWCARSTPKSKNKK